jgi:hypothetical protein
MTKKSKLFAKTFKVVIIDPDNNTYEFANRKPHKHHKYTYPLSLMFGDLFDYRKNTHCPKQVTLLQGAELLVKKLRLDNRLMRADLKTFSKNGGDTDSKHYNSRFKWRMDLADPATSNYAESSFDTTIVDFLSNNDKNIKYWASVVKTIKHSPEYLVYVLTK